MKLPAQIAMHAKVHPEQPVMISGPYTLTWGELWRKSDRLAAWIKAHDGGQSQPFAVYGHKHPAMLVCFLGCVKAGHAYCPIDVSVPAGRVRSILEMLPDGFLFLPEEAGELTVPAGKTAVDADLLWQITKNQSPEEPDAKQNPPCADGQEKEPEWSAWVSGEEIWYLIFTSGSTGTPKGVQITANALERFTDWAVNLGGPRQDKEGAVFLNQAPFSFDLSVMDLYSCLACGGTLFCLEKKVQGEYAALMKALGESGARVWVSTPSFAQLCLSDRAFTQDLLPCIRTFLFCGETLPPRTAEKLLQRFPKASVVNTYGPTESTVAVTEVTVTKEMTQSGAALPVGRAKPGTQIVIADESGAFLPDGEKGEILLLGDTVSPGYYRQEALTQKAFFTGTGPSGEPIRGYRTGDAGWLQGGMLYYAGRIDLQVKLHGYRIELGDIEENLSRLPEVAQAVVLPRERNGAVTSLTGVLVLAKEARDAWPDAADRADLTARLKQAVSVWLPAYMIPKKLVYLEKIPMTNNGKADRKQLKVLLDGGTL